MACPLAWGVGAAHGLQESSGASVLPDRVCSVTVPAPSQRMDPHCAWVLASRTDDTYVGADAAVDPIATTRPGFAVTARVRVPSIASLVICFASAVLTRLTAPHVAATVDSW